MSPGRTGPHSHEVDAKVTNPRRGADLCGDPLLSRHFEALKARDTGCARRPKVTREGVVAERRRGPVSKGTGDCRRGRFRTTLVQELPHLARGAAVRRAAGCESPDEQRVLEPRARAGQRLRGPEGKTLEGKKPRRGSADRREETRPGRDRTRRWDRRFEAGDARGRDRARGPRPERPGGPPRRAERELIAVGGARQPRQRVGVGETGGERSKVVRLRTRVDNCKGAKRASRGARDLLRGEPSEGRNPRDGCGTKQGHEAWAC
jgi:hypothetical protein